MRSLIFAGDGRVEWRDVADVRIASGIEAIIRPLVAGRCDLDIGFLRGIAPMAAGSSIGHEMIGEVIEVGDLVRRHKPGDRVVVPCQVSCGVCSACRHGQSARCQTVSFGAGYGLGRGEDWGSQLADRVRVPFADAMLVPVPASADPVALIGAADMAADAWRAVAPQLQLRPGGRVLVVCELARAIGVYAAGLAVALGAGAVDFWSHDPALRAEAERYGASPVDEPDGVYDIVVDGGGSEASIVAACRATAPDGLFTSVTIHIRELTGLPLAELYQTGIHMYFGRGNIRDQLPALINCCATGHFKPQAISTRYYDWDDAPAAWMDLESLCTVAVRPELRRAP